MTVEGEQDTLASETVFVSCYVTIVKDALCPLNTLVKWQSSTIDRNV